MAMDINVNATHAFFYPSKVLATRVGHTYNIVLTSDTDNGVIVGRGDYVSFDQYKQTTPPAAFRGKILEQAANGNWYVEVTATNPQVEAIAIYETVIPTRQDRDLRQEKLWYNKNGETVEGIVLTIGDVFEISKEGFSTTPTTTDAGKEVTVANKKLVIGS